MSYQVTARKWRPQTYQDLVGQETIAQTLLNALRANRLPHALLFSGARGVGKTSAARIFAKSLKCQEGKNFEPCNVCRTCTEITQGHHLDVIEIDGASHNGVDSVRELRESIGFMPSQGKYKVYIIDEVHMLSTSAFNALLKTLEEPPPHVVFVLATTEPQKIPITILSRCQRFDFRKIPTRQIAEHLQKICQHDGFQAPDETLWLIARQAGGSMRDSQSLFDQVINFTDGELGPDSVAKLLGLTDRKLLRDCLTALISRDMPATLNCLQNLHHRGNDPRVFLQELLEQIRHLLIAQLPDASAQKILDLSDSEIQFLKDLSQNVHEAELHVLFEMALKAYQDLSRTQAQMVVLEVSLLRMASAPKWIDLPQLFAGESSASLEGAVPRQSGVTAKTQSAPSTAVKKKSIATAVAPTTESQAPALSEEPLAAVKPPAEKPKPKALPFQPNRTLAENWFDLVEQIRTQNSLLASKLDHAALLEYVPPRAKLGFSKAQGFLAKQLGDKNQTHELLQVIQLFWSEVQQIDVLVVESSPNLSTPQNQELQKQAAHQDKIKKEVENHPFIRQTQAIFGAQIRSIHEEESQ